MTQIALGKFARATRIPMIVLIMRHGEAEPKSSGIPDDARSLSVIGKENNQRILALVVQLGLPHVDSIMSSPLRRAKQTAEMAQAILGSSNLVISPSLEPTSTPYEFYGELTKLGPTVRIVLAVTHQPLVGRIVSDLIASNSSNIAIPTSAIARIDIEEGREPASGSGTLRWLLSS